MEGEGEGYVEDAGDVDERNAQKRRKEGTQWRGERKSC